MSAVQWCAVECSAVELSGVEHSAPLLPSGVHHKKADCDSAAALDKVTSTGQLLSIRVQKLGKLRKHIIQSGF